MKQRIELTEDEHENLLKIGDDFYEAFLELCAEHIVRMPRELEDITMMYLGEKTSIYSPGITKKLRAARVKVEGR